MEVGFLSLTALITLLKGAGFAVRNEIIIIKRMENHLGSTAIRFTAYFHSSSKFLASNTQPPPKPKKMIN